MAKLVLTADGYFKGEFDIKPGVNRIGRGPSNDIQIPAGSISTTHCELTYDPVAGSLSIKDLGSTNGTFISGQRVMESNIVDGQVLRLGEVEMKCQLSELPEKPRLEASVPPLPPPIADEPPPKWSAPSGVPTNLVCQNHLQVPATMICKKCGRTVCNACVNMQRVGSQKLNFCKACGDECITLAEHFHPKREDERSFFQLLPGAFSFPFKGDGVILLIAGAVFFTFIRWLRGYTFLISIMLTVLAIGYMFATMQNIMVGAAMGEEKPPSYPDLTDFMADVVHPYLLLMGTTLFCLLPVLLYLWISDEGAAFRLEISIALIVLGALYFPMALLAVGIHETLYALNPLLIVVSIAKMPMEYLVTCVLLGIVVICELLAKFLVILPVIGGLASMAVSLYFMFVEMRILGLLFYSKRRALGWQVF